MFVRVRTYDASDRQLCEKIASGELRPDARIREEMMAEELTEAYRIRELLEAGVIACADASPGGKLKITA